MTQRIKILTNKQINSIFTHQNQTMKRAKQILRHTEMINGEQQLYQ